MRLIQKTIVSKNLYNYCKRNLLDKPESYMYSTIGEEAFLRDYRDLREDYLANQISLLPSSFDKLTELDSFLKLCPEFLAHINLSYNIKDKHSSSICFIVDDVIQTSKLLQSIALNLHTGEKEISYKWLSLLIKRFEVFKKIHSRFNQNFKKVDDEYHDLFIYAATGFLLLIYFEKYGNLKFLNCALKINDLLCSIDNRSIDKQTLLLSTASLFCEKKLVLRLINEKNISLC